MPTPTPVDLLCEQLWRPALSTGHVRVDVGPVESSGWSTVERYWMVPDARRARLIVAAAPRTVTSRLLTNYRQLRTPAVHLLRAGLGATARVGLPLSISSLQVQVSDQQPEAVRQLPLHLIAAELGEVYAAAGIRSGDNRKATLHLADGVGAPVGYAKVGWNATIDHAIRTEASTLKDIGGGSSPVRSPSVLAQVDYAGHPILVTSPLPIDVRPAEPEDVTSQEMHGLTPIVRFDRLGNSAQYRAVLGRLAGLRLHGVVGEPAEQAHDLLRDAERSASDVHVPLCSRWHGDFAPWNMARGADGTLWLWDWESSEPDALAGLDALHWSASLARIGSKSEPGISELLDRSLIHLVAAGVPIRARWVVAACYVATIVERACALAAQANSWEGARQPPALLSRLMRETKHGLQGAPDVG